MTSSSVYNTPSKNSSSCSTKASINNSNTNTPHISSKSTPSKPNSNHSFTKLKVGQLRHHEIEHFFTNEKEVVHNCEPVSWSNCDATTFHVRRGPNYISGQKTPSQKAIYEVFAIDAYSNSNKINFFQQFLNIDEHVKNYCEKYDYHYHKELCPLPPIIICNVMVPNYAPEMTTSKSDGDGFQMVLCAQLNQDVREFYQARYRKYFKHSNGASSASSKSASASVTDSPSLSEPSSSSELVIENVLGPSAGKSDAGSEYMPPSFQLLSNFVHSNLCDKENNPLRNRFKCIARVMNIESSGFNFITKRLVQQYNGRPFLARTSSTFYHKRGEYFSADIDVHLFGYPARKGLYYTKSTVAEMIFDLAMVIEGHSNNELPEQVLCCARISKVGVETVLKFPEHLQKYYNSKKGKNENEDNMNDERENKNEESNENVRTFGGGGQSKQQQYIMSGCKSNNGSYSSSIIGSPSISNGSNNGKVKETKNGGYYCNTNDNHVIRNESSLGKLFGVFAWSGNDGGQ